METRQRLPKWTVGEIAEDPKEEDNSCGKWNADSDVSLEIQDNEIYFVSGNFIDYLKYFLSKIIFTLRFIKFPEDTERQK